VGGDELREIADATFHDVQAAVPPLDPAVTRSRA